MEISSSNQAQLAQFQRVQNQDSQALDATQAAQASSSSSPSTPSSTSPSTQAQNSTVTISQEARERFTAEQASGTNDTVELQSSGSTAEKPR